jgi:hydroxymethylpyrimidine/phosphomethylpyrimidine kinase
MWQAMPADLVTAQIEAIAEDIPPQAVKVGMLANAAVTEAVAAAIAELDLPHVVVDPVMIAKGGDRLLEEEAIEAIRTELLPRAHVVTPNISEAEVLSGLRITDIEGMRRAGKAILGLGPRLVIVKGGHLEGPESVDVVTGIHEEFEVRGPRIPGRNTHGTGCTLSSAIAANLARGLTDRAAITRARQYLEGAIRHAPGLGRGHGPLQHFWGRYTENR